MLWSAFTHKDPKSAKRLDQGLDCLFALLWFLHKKAASKHAGEIDPCILNTHETTGGINVGDKILDKLLF